jgi:hypothetical protein
VALSARRLEATPGIEPGYADLQPRIPGERKPLILTCFPDSVKKALETNGLSLTFADCGLTVAARRVTR